MELSEFKECALNVKKALEKVFGTQYYVVNIGSFGRSLTLTALDPNDSTRIYIRIDQYRGKLAININSIEFEDEIKGKGVFSKTVKELRKINSASYVMITSIISQEMLSICKHMNFKAADYSGMDFYIETIEKK